MKHPHAEIIKALADDDSQWLWRKHHTGQWYAILHNKINHVLGSGGGVQFHLGPTPPSRMIETPYGSYPEPLKEAPEKSTVVFRVEADGETTSMNWEDYSWQRTGLSAGVFHLTREAAKQQVQVELKRRMAELGWEKS